MMLMLMLMLILKNNDDDDDADDCKRYVLQGENTLCVSQWGRRGVGRSTQHILDNAALLVNNSSFYIVIIIVIIQSIYWRMLFCEHCHSDIPSMTSCSSSHYYFQRRDLYLFLCFCFCPSQSCFGPSQPQLVFSQMFLFCTKFTLIRKKLGDCPFLRPKHSLLDKKSLTDI